MAVKEDSKNTPFDILEDDRAIRAVLGPEAEVLTLPKFLRLYVPSLDDIAIITPPPATEGHSRGRRRHRGRPQPSSLTYQLNNTRVAPLGSCVVLNKVKKPVRIGQSLSSLVDDLVWALVQQAERQRLKNGSRKKPNLLCQGYSAGLPYTSNSGNSSGGPVLTNTHINNNVDFCKTSPIFRLLHEKIGDDAMRMLLMHCSVFVPVVGNDERGKGNFMQLTGPPLQPKLLVQTNINNNNKRKKKGSKGTKKKRKRNRSLRPSTGKDDDKEERESQHKIPKHLEPQSFISRKALFYSNSFVPKIGLPSNHMLNDPSGGPRELLDAIFELDAVVRKGGKNNRSTGNKRRRTKRCKRLGEDGIQFCKDILRLHRSCDYARLLNHYCPLPEICRRGRSYEVSLEVASASYTPTNNVVSFVRACVHRILPPTFLGSAQNIDHLLNNQIDTFIKLRRQEQLPNKCLLNGIQLTKIRWLFAAKQGKVSRSDHQAAELLLLRILRWLFSQFIIPLLGSCFYVTESEATGRQLLYYRKPAWSIFRSLSMRKLLDQQYTEISAEDAALRLQQQRMGLSRLRLLPKMTGVRPIATMCKRENLRIFKRSNQPGADRVVDDVRDEDGPPRKKQKSDNQSLPLLPSGDPRSTNEILNDTFTVLQYERERQEDSFGAGLDGLHYFYPKYRRFLERRKQSRDKNARIYFGSCDIKKCFDNIDQSHLLSVAERIFQEDDYLIQRYDAFHPFESMGRVFKRKKKRAGPPEDYGPFYNKFRDIAEDHHQTVFVDGVKCSLAKKDRLMEQLREHLTSHLVTVQGRYADRFLLQSTGIPQGSVLSTLLCNMYYGNIEKQLLPDHLKDDAEDLLARMVDDFLLMTTDMVSLQNFFKIMYRGEPRLGVNINKIKTQVSSPVSFENDDGTTCSLAPAGFSENEEGGCYFPWCGMLFDTKKGDVRVDYLAFAGKAGDVLTVDRVNSQGDRLAVAMKTFVRPRCIPILFDSTINSNRTQMINFYQLIVFGAVKTSEYIRSSDLIIAQRSNITFLLGLVNSTISYAYNLINERLKHHHSDLITGFKRPVALWLGYKAFTDTLQLLPAEFHFLKLAVKEKLACMDATDFVRLMAAEARKSMPIKRLFS